MSILDIIRDKLNPSQPDISINLEGSEISTTKPFKKFGDAYRDVEVVNRGVNMLVDSAVGLEFDIGDKLAFTGPANIRRNKLALLLNKQPNLFQDASAFKRNLYTDFLVEGNAFIYFDGAHLYHLPASNVIIKTDKKTFIESYEYNNVFYSTEEIIHIKENSATSIYRGDSRLASCLRSINTLYKMRLFQDNFFDNGAVPGLVLKTPNTLSTKIKDRLLASWRSKYNPKTGGRTPLILDGGLDISPLSNTNFQQLDFDESLKTLESRILQAIGVPPVLLDGGNNANISPNTKLMYHQTVIPLVKKFNSAFERFFTYDIDLATQKVFSLRPELKDESQYNSTLVNNGIMTGAEARELLRLEPIDDEALNTIRIPANVAGAATGVAGESDGKPVQDTSEE
jgi:HK97 family phage portal protein